MLGICSACGNHEWDKEVKGNIIKCLNVAMSGHLKNYQYIF